MADYEVAEHRTLSKEALDKQKKDGIIAEFLTLQAKFAEVRELLDIEREIKDDIQWSMDEMSVNLTRSLDELSQEKDEADRKSAEVEKARQLAETQKEMAERQKLEALKQLQIIEEQTLTIKMLSTPILNIWDDVLALPVIGIVDSSRASEMMERLLQAISEKGSKFVILDITGVDTVDTMTADHFIKMMKAAKLMGSRCILTGLSPEVAQTLTQLGIDLTELVTLRTIKDGLKMSIEALNRWRGSRDGDTDTDN